MSEMVERIARAICYAHAYTMFFDHPEEERVAQARAHEERDWQTFVHAAKEGISAMREPTEAMLDAADNTDIEVGEYLIRQPHARLCWQAMIDEALK